MMDVVQHGDEFHVIDPQGHLMAAWPTEPEAHAWLAGISYGAEAALQAIHLADEDTKRRMQGLVRIVTQYVSDAKTASIVRRKAG